MATPDAARFRTTEPPRPPSSTKFSTYFLRGLVRHCPNCGSGHLFRHWFRMAERCPRCGLKFERVEGHWTGALGINTIVVFGAILVTLLVGVFVTWPEPQVVPMVVVGLFVALAGPFIFFPFSKTIWLAIDVAIRPVEPSELVATPPTTPAG